jgi:ceramide glucosyltransferase
MLYLLVCLFLLSLSSILYYCYSIYAVIDFFSHPIEIDNNFHPPISILKPICGVDWELYENLISFCQQDYPKYQIIFSVRDSKDPSIEIIKKIIDRLPDLDLSLVIRDRTIGTNLKVSNLANAEVEAKYSILLISDSDIRVKSDYLKQIVQPMCDSKVGVVTCLYNSLVKGWVAAFEALDISTQFHSRVLTARKLEGVKFALGSTIVIRKTVLEEIGGFLSIADYLADDFQLGNLPAQKGYKVVLSNYIVEHILANVTIHDFLQRQIRWAKVIRVERFWGYLGLIFTQGTTIGLLFWLATLGSRLGWFVLLVIWSMRLLMAWILGIRSLKDPVAKKFFWLVPFRDLVSFAIWFYSLVGNKIEWRGRKFKLVESGKLALLN